MTARFYPAYKTRVRTRCGKEFDILGNRDKFLTQKIVSSCFVVLDHKNPGVIVDGPFAHLPNANDRANALNRGAAKTSAG